MREARGVEQLRYAVVIGSIIAATAIGVVAWLVLSPTPHRELLAQARAEGTVVVWGNADSDAVAPMIAAFERQTPGVRVRYADLESSVIYDRVLAAARGDAMPDLVWSSAMDLQAKLVNDGYAQRYRSTQVDALPPEAVWKEMGYGITAEPVALVYNKALIASADVPRTHRALASFLERRRDALLGKVATYDPARSNVGYLYVTQDMTATRDTRGLLRALAATRPRLSRTTEPMMRAVADGRVALAYNVVGPYAARHAAADPRIGVVYPSDYTLVASRVVFIPRAAPHPAGARLLLDFMLSREGQALLARAYLPPIRTDLAAEFTPLAQARAIRGGPQLFVNIDPVKRRRFLDEWNAILAEGGNKQ